MTSEESSEHHLPREGRIWTKLLTRCTMRKSTSKGLERGKDRKALSSESRGVHTGGPERNRHLRRKN